MSFSASPEFRVGLVERTGLLAQALTPMKRKLHSPSQSKEPSMPNSLSAQEPAPVIILSPIRSGIPADGGTLEVLVRVQAGQKPAVAPQEATKTRASFRLALVVDRSGSMSGKPLTEALRCVNHIAGRLQPTDEVAVVLYDDQVQRPVPLRRATNPAAVQAALSGVESGGSTNLFAGWEAGARQLESGTKDSISRVILLSDGQANQGLVDQAQIEQHCARWLATGVSTTTVGLGRGFNEDLMFGMARAGGGQQYYGQTAEDLFDGFDEELALLEAMCLRNLRVKLIPGAGVIVEPLGLVRQNADQTLALTDLAWGAESWVLVRLHVSKIDETRREAAPTPTGQRGLLSVVLQAETMDGDALAVTSPVLAPEMLDLSAWNDLPSDPLVVQRLKEIEFGEASGQVRALLIAGDTEAAKALMATMEANVAQHPWLQTKLAKLKELAERDVQMASKELRYSSMKMSSRLSSQENVAFCLDETSSNDVPAYLRRKTSEGTGRKT
jgi:Ca-activated chloride channel family protein